MQKEEDIQYCISAFSHVCTYAANQLIDMCLLCSTPLTPDPRCRGDHVYKECGSHCGSTCQNLYGPQPVCDESCFEGCFCSDGLIPLSSNSSKCFYRDECPPPRCPGDKVFTTCGTACPRTCENKNEIIPCTLQCVIGTSP